MYGFDSGESTPKLQFGLNQKFKLTKLAFNANAGKDNSPQDALDIVFTSPSGAEISYRQFPITKAQDENGNEVTDARHPAMRKAFKNFNAKVSQIVSIFLSEEEIRDALEEVNSFKAFCDALANALPANYAETEIDLIAQYQWQPKGESTTKYLELPKNVKQGKCFVPHVEGNFSKVVVTEDGTAYVNGAEVKGVEDGNDFVFNVQEKELRVSKKLGLLYVDFSGDEIVKHPISRSQWYMDSNWAKASNDEVSDTVNSGW